MQASGTYTVKYFGVNVKFCNSIPKLHTNTLISKLPNLITVLIKVASCQLLCVYKPVIDSE
jgi:hypothetical protein